MPRQSSAPGQRRLLPGDCLRLVVATLQMTSLRLSPALFVIFGSVKASVPLTGLVISCASIRDAVLSVKSDSFSLAFGRARDVGCAAQPALSDQTAIRTGPSGGKFT